MSGSDKNWTLEELLVNCCANKSRLREQAWQEFLRRYKKFIYSIVINTCRRYNVARLGLQFSDTVNDIFQEVMMTLLKNDCRALRNVRAKDNEKQFLSYIAVTVHFASSAHIKKYFKSLFSEDEPSDAINAYIGALAQPDAWILYEDVVDLLRSGVAGGGRYLERNINIFMMYKWRALPQPAIRSIPCLKTIGERVIEVEAARILKVLKQWGESENLLRGSGDFSTHNSQERNKSCHLGQAVAVLESPEVQLKLTNLPESLRNLVLHLHKIQKAIVNDGQAQATLIDIPKGCCRIGKSFLDGNEAFFVTRFSVEVDEQDFSSSCHELAKHLNDCFHCFNIFSEFVGVYYGAKQEMRQVK